MQSAFWIVTDKIFESVFVLSHVSEDPICRELGRRGHERDVCGSIRVSRVYIGNDDR